MIMYIFSLVFVLFTHRDIGNNDKTKVCLSPLPPPPHTQNNVNTNGNHNNTQFAALKSGGNYVSGDDCTKNGQALTSDNLNKANNGNATVSTSNVCVWTSVPVGVLVVP